MKIHHIYICRNPKLSADWLCIHTPLRWAPEEEQSSGSICLTTDSKSKAYPSKDRVLMFEGLPKSELVIITDTPAEREVLLLTPDLTSLGGNRYRIPGELIIFVP
ncbi:MAG: hypothetical protein V4438_00945 [Patescibacteria group bacterium]